MKTRRQKLGQWGEQLAARYLQDQGYEILAQNVRTPYGELDLVARQTATAEEMESLVFVEVKTRTSTSFGLPEESVTAAKQAHLLAAVQAYLLDHPEEDGNWRVDVIAILRPRRGGPAEIKHFQYAI